MNSQAQIEDAGQWLSRRYVRVKDVRNNGLVEFEFAVGDPDTCVELLMPKIAFEEFCVANHVVVLEGRSEEDERSPWNASLHDAHRRGLK